MNLLEKIEAALDSATPPVADLLRECEAYVRAGMDQPPIIYIAEDDVGDFMASRTPDGDYPWEPLYRLLSSHHSYDEGYKDGYANGFEKGISKGSEQYPEHYLSSMGG